MPQLTIKMTEAELFALDLIAVDKQQWADNVLTNRARVAKDELKTSPAWTQAAVATAKEGGNPDDDWAVLLKAKQLKLFQTAGEQAANTEAEQITGISVPDVIVASPALVDREVIQRKMKLVGASDVNQLHDITLRGTREAVKLLQAKADADGILTKEQAARAKQLDKIETAFEALEHIGELIKADIASGKITNSDKITTDKRWENSNEL